VPVAINYDRVLEDTILIKAVITGYAALWGRRCWRYSDGWGWHHLAGHAAVSWVWRGVCKLPEMLELSRFHAEDSSDLTKAIATELMEGSPM
jgi:hypothetical protein